MAGLRDADAGARQVGFEDGRRGVSRSVGHRPGIQHQGSAATRKSRAVAAPRSARFPREQLSVQVGHCEEELREFQLRLRNQERRVNNCERAVEKYKANIDQFTAWRDALLDNLKKAQTAYDDACKAYEEAKAAADKATSPEITQPTETTPPSNSAQPAETAQPASSPATGKNTPPSSTKQANSSSGKQADTTAGKLANTGDTAPSAITLAAVAAAGLGITATATRRIKNSK